MFLALRIAAALPTLAGVSLVAFLLVHLAPGDPIATLTQGLASQDVVASLRAYYGFDRSLPEQYVRWLANVLVGDFGVSVTSGQRIAPLLSQSFGNTLKIVIPAALLAIAAGWLIGSAAAQGRTRSAWLRGVAAAMSGLASVLASLPPYWIGLVLIAVFGVALAVLPVMGIGPATTLDGLATASGLQHLILPAVTLAITPAGILALSTQSAIEAASKQDFVEAMRARGITDARIRRRVRRNALPSLFALYGLQVAYLLGASILIETVFAWPGIGTFLANAIQQRDMPSIQAALLIIGSCFVVMNLLADLLQSAADPRIHR